jgi:hypothetical protein
MERNDVYLLGGVGVAGFAAGGLLGYLYARNKLQRQLDAEVAEVREHFAERLAEVKRVRSERAAASVVRPRVAAERTEGDGSEAADHELGAVPGEPLSDEEEGCSDEALEETTGDGPEPESRDPERPYVISEEEFSEEYLTHDKLSVTYYSGDGVLVDDAEDPIRDIRGTTGEAALKLISTAEGDRKPTVVYVRNEKKGIDFEVVANYGSYLEEVLNYGNPEPNNGTRKRGDRRTNG